MSSTQDEEDVRIAEKIIDLYLKEPPDGSTKTDILHLALTVKRLLGAQFPGSRVPEDFELSALGDDARKWAQAFSQSAVNLGYPPMDEGWLIAWFANAIEHSSDVRRWRRECKIEKE